MAVIEFEIDADQDSPPIAVPTSGGNLYQEYLATPWLEEHYDPSNFQSRLHRPIRHVKVSRALSGDGYKPCYLFASILPKHVGTGEKTNVNKNLARMIRYRGKRKGDDCGHIIAAQLGGKMVEFNLFPQDKRINRGIYGLNKWWRKGVEKIILAWLTLPKNVKPCVEFEIILYYEDPEYLDRPTRGKFLITMKMDDDDDDDDEEEDDDDEDTVLHPTLKGELLNELELAEEDVRESVYERINWTKFSKHFGNCYSLYRKFLKELFKATIELGKIPVKTPTPIKPPTPIPAPAPSPRGSNTPFSWWDIVPVVGSVRNIVQGVEDAEDGNALGATSNVALGLGGLILDVISLGTLSSVGRSIAKEGGKQVLKEGGKQIAKEGAKDLAKEGGKQMGKIATRTVVKEVVKDVAVITCRAAAAAKFATYVLQRPV
ncbi:uncharacterized protein LOC118436552 [Folsomia candida]|uniref:Uncharacterized protein n=1 Tax=Folsomia candida TaxID=158441 RepID=A0A226E0B2_FOLCA|nr:uncharacterized protein LOC118436552 [Folsomia candida]OXA50407.1 hypothetical protein Fcan01_14950 [Folsomia candida]